MNIINSTINIKNLLDVLLVVVLIQTAQNDIINTNIIIAKIRTNDSSDILLIYISH